MWTTLHCLYVFNLAEPLPVDHLPEALFEDHVQPDASSSPVSVHEWMGNVHLHVLCDDILKSRFGHLFNGSKRSLQIQTVCESAIALGNVHPAELARKIVQALEKIPVYRAKALCRADFHPVDVATFEQAFGPDQTLFVQLHVLFPIPQLRYMVPIAGLGSSQDFSVPPSFSPLSPITMAPSATPRPCMA